jgi:1-acyl-sn-glycerol-3-phosphate acyltransferase
MPPTAIRRPLTIGTWLLVSSACLILSPLLLAVGAAWSAWSHRPQPLLLARLLVAYFYRELLVLVGCGGLWLASGCGWRIHSAASRRRHFALLRWFVSGLSGRARDLLDIDVAPDTGSEAAAAMRRDGPLLFFSRHAGPGDTVLLIDLLLTTHDRLPSVVFKESLMLDPSIDLLGHRLPHAALNTAEPEDCQRRIQEVSSKLGSRGVLVLFPEGGNLTAQRRRASIAKLWRKGRRREAAAGEQLQHVLPPHPTGALAALQGNPECDVIFGAHTGLGLAAFPGQLWHDTPIGRTLTTRMWRVPADERPSDPDEQVRWLYDWWRRLDEWLDAEGEPLP